MSVRPANAPIVRSELTGAVVAHLIDKLVMYVPGILVGRGTAPPAGGWSQGQPGIGTFVPYVTVKTGTAVSPVDPQPLSRNRTSWEVSYSLTSTGMMESHCDGVADQVRAAIVALPQAFTLGGVGWILQQVKTPRLGPTNRNDSTDPPFWEVTDVVSLHLSQERTS
jgi:hypothetical protein